MINPFPVSSKNELAAAVEELNQCISYKEDLDTITVAIDVVATAFAAAAGIVFDDNPEMTKSVFVGLVGHGLNKRAIELVTTLAEIASLTLYDDTQECDEKLEEAEDLRLELYELLTVFLTTKFGKSEKAE